MQQTEFECSKCETIHYGKCHKCGNQGGYLLKPSYISIEGVIYHRKDILNHQATGNRYQIKEIQNKGFLCKFIYSPIVPENARKGLKVYIGYSDISIYKKG